MSSGREYKTRVFCITREDDRTEYEGIKQKAVVEEDSTYEIVKETETWTRDGDHFICLHWVETLVPTEEPERF
jgi:hypothetical protein